RYCQYLKEGAELFKETPMQSRKAAAAEPAPSPSPNIPLFFPSISLYWVIIQPGVGRSGRGRFVWPGQKLTEKMKKC
ncbi:hypothetical protein NW857_09465, partial [Synechococcus sp. H55.9]|uniref:hypothetical protein n=1 Tax=Synechococcus sp. H55.9 TaxID=2964511 RepID=UPI0039C4DF3F